MNYKVKYIPKIGLVNLIDENNTLIKNIQFGILNLNNSSFSKKVLDMETVLVILSGVCSVEVNGKGWNSIGGRKNVFDGKAYAVYIPPHSEFKINSEIKAEIAICSSPASIKSKPQLITPSDVRLNVVGRDNWQRNVYDIIKDNVDAEKLVVGETITPPGNWSSYPPHKHDENSEYEAKMEEIYFFKIFPEYGFGLQRLYTPDRDNELL
ncbi:MAG: 5-deoxy-glucuronate isomerase [Candidatus Helarchaeota archaeon]